MASLPSVSGSSSLSYVREGPILSIRGNCEPKDAQVIILTELHGVEAIQKEIAKVVLTACSVPNVKPRITLESVSRGVAFDPETHTMTKGFGRLLKKYPVVGWDNTAGTDAYMKKVWDDLALFKTQAHTARMTKDFSFLEKPKSNGTYISLLGYAPAGTIAFKGVLATQIKNYVTISNTTDEQISKLVDMVLKQLIEANMQTLYSESNTSENFLVRQKSLIQTINESPTVPGEVLMAFTGIGHVLPLKKGEAFATGTQILWDALKTKKFVVYVPSQAYLKTLKGKGSEPFKKIEKLYTIALAGAKAAPGSAEHKDEKKDDKKA